MNVLSISFRSPRRMYTLHRCRVVVVSICILCISDCIEAGLPYDWARLGIDSDKEETIVRALLAATGNDHPPAATGRGSTTAPAAACPHAEDEAAGASFGALPLAASGPPVGGVQAAVLPSPTAVATGALGDGCGGAASAAAAVGTAEGRRGEERGGDGSRSANVAMRGVSRSADVRGEGGFNPENDGDCHGHGHGESSSQGRAIIDDGNRNGAGTAAARPAPPTGGEEAGAEGATKGASETGRWDSVRLKEVKELAPGAEYWEIRMVLARLKAGWCGYSS